MIRLFISYRRSDSAHAAQRVRSYMQARFGADAAFIDRDIPPGAAWADYLGQQLESSSDVIVLVGDAFLRELRRRGNAADADEQDWLKTEIRSALQLKKSIYPAIIGRLDMPDANDLPLEIRDFSRSQAVFAREPAFDAAMAVLADTIAAKHGWIAPAAAAHKPASPADALRPLAGVAVLGGLAVLGLWLLGRLIQWLSTGAAGAAVEPAFWLGAHYALLTLLWGLGPYLVYRAVAELRARARLPVHNLLGALTMLNLGLALLAGGSFLLLSTRAEWVLRLRWVVSETSGPLHYALQGGVLLLIVFAAALVAMLEPVVRSWTPARRRWGVAALYAAGVAVVIASGWFVEALVRSVRPLQEASVVPLIGYFMLTPALSALVGVWDLARWSLGIDAQARYSRALFVLAVSLYGACTLAYYAHGPVHLFAELALARQ